MNEPERYEDTPCYLAALEYLERGFSVLPVHPGTKRPLIRWKEFQGRLPTEDEVTSWWRLWPHAQLGMVTGLVSGRVVLDSDSAEGNLALRQYRTTVYVQRGERCHAHYRTEKRIKSNRSFPGGLELKAEGSFVMLPPSTHPSGDPYAWVFASDDAEDTLPCFETLEGAPFSLLADGEEVGGDGNLDLDLSRIAAPAAAGLDLSPAKKGERNSRLASIVGCLINAGHAQDDVLSMAALWNAKNDPPLSELELRRTVRSVFRTHAANHPADPGPTDSEETDYNAYVPEPGEIEREETFPADLLEPGGIVQDLMSYVRDSVPVSIPHFDMAAALVVVGTLVGQKFQSPTGLRTNLYVVGIAPSGAGKNGPKETLRPLAAISDGARLFGPEHMTGAPAVIAHLAANPVCGLFLDEFGHFLAAVKSGAVPMKAELAGVLSELYTSARSLYVKSYADPKLNRIIHYPHLSFYGTTTPARFWEPITRGDFEDGFLGRILFLFGSKQPVQIDYAAPLKTSLPPSLLAGLNGLTQIPYRQQAGVSGNIDRERFHPDPVVLRFARGAEALFNDWAADVRERESAAEENDPVLAAVYARCAEKALKLAMINAVGNGHMEEIPSSIVEWAVRVVCYLTRRLIANYRPEVAGTDLERFQNKIVRFILGKVTQEKPGVTEAELRRAFRGRTKRVWDDTLGDMVRSGVLFVDKRPETVKRLRIQGGLFCLSRKYMGVL